MYNYKNRYLFQSNVRYDGSSRFAADYRWGFFPSFSAGWVISDEAFMKNVPVLSYLKLRASWGSLGNERIGNYPYQSTVSFSNSLFYNAETTTVISKQTAYIGKYAIKDISWETTESFDIGIDAFLFDNKMQIIADYYDKTTRDMLLALEIPNYIGLDNPDQNTGKMSTKGWEFEIRYNDKIGDLNYSVSGNISDFKSVMGDLGGTEFLGSQVKFQGSEFNEWYGYVSEGLYQTAEEVAGSAKINNRVSPGDIKYKDISGPNGEPDGIINSAYDRALLGGSLPRYEYGGNIRLDYKNIDFSLVFQGVGKINSYMTSIMARPLQGGVYNVPEDVIGNYWSKYNTEQRNKEVFYPRLSEVSAGGQAEASGNNYVTSDYWLFNGGYFRLKNIVLGYSLPKSIVQKLSLNNVRIYANLSDLFSIDKWKGGYDPESGSSGYFIQKSYLFGISVKF
jgi:TonB-linked SusC/RagA family outer membrane protein